MMRQIRCSAIWCWCSIVLGVGCLATDSAEAGFTITDLGVVFAARLRNGTLEEIHQTDESAAQVRLSTTSDVLVSMVDGEMSMAKAWSAGRVKIEASMMDMLKLRSAF